mmetsp:Transcript_25186/g.69457  ORF Transcript_25186/g.69457 Transcript_25186/m.69457 type:complete len:334 (-) Transcript_25186:281-1282(-)
MGTGGRDILQPCVHRECATSTAIIHCSLLAVMFVASLYIFVPLTVRKLPRNHPTQIQFRSLACLIVCAAGMWSYPYLFCDGDEENVQIKENLFSVWKIMFSPSPAGGTFRGTFGILLHTCILYTGSSFTRFLYVYESHRHSMRQGQNQNLFEFTRYLFPAIMLPQTSVELWTAIRNCVVAPLTEEVVFRGCMVPVLLATGMSIGKVSLVAPVFFGFAHLHHAATRLSTGDPPRLVMMATTFQFLYTSLFGSYASYAFIRTGSVLPVIFSHSYCNWMGLPNIGFLGNSHHPLHRHRTAILSSYILGIVAFAYSLTIDVFLPLPSVLPELIKSKL